MSSFRVSHVLLAVNPSGRLPAADHLSQYLGMSPDHAITSIHRVGLVGSCNEGCRDQRKGRR